MVVVETFSRCRFVFHDSDSLLILTGHYHSLWSKVGWRVRQIPRSGLHSSSAWASLFALCPCSYKCGQSCVGDDSCHMCGLKVGQVAFRVCWFELFPCPKVPKYNIWMLLLLGCHFQEVAWSVSSVHLVFALHCVRLVIIKKTRSRVFASLLRLNKTYWLVVVLVKVVQCDSGNHYTFPHSKESHCIISF